MVAARGRADQRNWHAEHFRPHFLTSWSSLGRKERKLVRSLGRRALASPIRSWLEFLCNGRRRRVRRRQQVLLAGAYGPGLRILPVKNHHMERDARLQGA